MTMGNECSANKRFHQFIDRDSFSRLDESDDRIFYSRDRYVSHLDTTALETVEALIQNLVIDENAIILDLMASWDSHIPSQLHSCKVFGLGLNENELKRNQRLFNFAVHDLNRNPILPFPDNTFDAVINTISVDYMTQPVEVFRDVNRILKPGGLFLVIFSNRMFPEKAVKIWRETSEDEHIMLVEEFFHEAGGFDKTNRFVSKGKPRPKDDKYAYLGTPSDPVYAVYTEKSGGDQSFRAQRSLRIASAERIDVETLERRKKRIKETLRCPYCGEKLKKWAVPDNPFEATWGNEYLYICFNDHCAYYVRGWNHMAKSINRNASYRLMYNQEKDICSPIPVPSPKALRENIID
jgi:SAM-dependent methyltransferase